MRQNTYLRLFGLSLQTVFTLFGSIFVDVDANGVYNTPPDLPKSSLPISLISLSTRRAAVPLPASTTTTFNGSFLFNVVDLLPGHVVGVSTRRERSLGT